MLRNQPLTGGAEAQVSRLAAPASAHTRPSHAARCEYASQIDQPALSEPSLATVPRPASRLADRRQQPCSACFLPNRASLTFRNLDICRTPFEQGNLPTCFW